MTSNDAQMDVLLRRFAGQSQGSSATEHLDADELAAFAEGSLPEAARTRYVSHLVDCDNCRQVVSHLAISSGAVVAAEAPTAVEASGYSWSKRLGRFLSPMTLRYAAFAIVLITAAGVVFLVTRRARESNLVAQSDRQQSPPQSAVKPYGDGTSPNAGTLQSEANNNEALKTKPTPQTQASPKTDEIARLEQPRSADSAVSPPKPAKEGEVTSVPGQVASKRAEPAEIASAPSYAPPAAAERVQIQTGQQQNSGGFSSTSGPRKSGPADQFKTTDKASRVGEVSKDNTGADENTRLATNRPASSRRAGDEKVKGPRRDLENNVLMSRNADDVRARNAQGIVAPSPPIEEKPPETRSAGGRKFRRQGNAWVDAKFKSSMPLKSISRGSSEFGALDSGLRSIAQQLGGQVTVVWKNKAYVIK
ncbi:MAG: hypothetical protein QOH71_2545 [Blastocatellia bacterium]|nr:hypothetical protein [Blastocatellia bacterium]